MIDTAKLINKLTPLMDHNSGRMRIEKLTRTEAEYIKSRLNGHEGYRIITIHHEDIAEFQNSYVNSWGCKMIMLFCDNFKPNKRTLTISDLIKT
jgi:hypothetical protein